MDLLQLICLLFGHIYDDFADGKDVAVSVMSATGEEQINALKEMFWLCSGNEIAAVTALNISNWL